MSKTINRSVIFAKLNPLTYQAAEAAYHFCKLRQHGYVEMVHWLHQLLQFQDTDLKRIVQQYDLNRHALDRDITQALERLSAGPGSSQVNFSAHIDEAIEAAWLKASLFFGVNQIRSGHLLAGMLDTRPLAAELYQISDQFKRIKYDDLMEGFDDFLAQSPEAALVKAEDSRTELATGEQSALQRYTLDLTEQARQGQIDPIVGRDAEIRQLIDILMRRRQNNPILTGEAGVGKTAVVEGFALRIHAKDVPPALQNVALRSLDMGRLQAGASMKGEFEQRLRSVIDEVQASEQPIILFIDEAHTLMGAGGAAGTNDAANLLKPALARGGLRTIAATTWAEYKKYIEKDDALTRRFQVVQINEPDEAKATLMLRGVAAVMEAHHGVPILDQALAAAVRLSHRYIPARQLPDKAVSLLDTACARVAISQHALPGAIDDLRRQIQALHTEQQILQREQRLGMDLSQGKDQERLQAIAAQLRSLQQSLTQMEEKWQHERSLVERIMHRRRQLGQQPAEQSEPEVALPAATDDLAPLQADQQALAQLQGESALIFPMVDEQAVASVVQDWTGIPVGRMVKDEMNTVLNLAQIMSQRIIGQDDALQMIAKRVQTSRAGLDDPNKPIGVFLLAGTSGVGKTETALALAEALYGGEHNVITINMSEFQEAHTVSTLKGAPPGYVGYGEGGLLTEAVRRKPYSVILLDEVEKAHSDVHEIFFQVFDKGVMEDGEGREIDFRNTLILLTTNAGSDCIVDLCADADYLPSIEGMAKALHKPLLQHFPAALLGRLVVVPYYPLSQAMLMRITQLQLQRIQRRLQQQDIELRFDDQVLQLIVERCTELDSGGRMIDSILTNTLLPHISQRLLSLRLQGRTVDWIRLGVSDKRFTYDYSDDLPSVDVQPEDKTAQLDAQGA